MNMTKAMMKLEVMKTDMSETMSKTKVGGRNTMVGDGYDFDYLRIRSVNQSQKRYDIPSILLKD